MGAKYLVNQYDESCVLTDDQNGHEQDHHRGYHYRAGDSDCCGYCEQVQMMITMRSGGSHEIDLHLSH